MPPQVPGFNVTALRQQTFARRNQPVLISGRVTVFGLGAPAFVRVFLEGTSHNPDIRSFDAFAAPFSGDYSVPVLAEKDGQYQVYAQAFFPLALPVPGAPEPLFLGPPLAESPRPSLAIGERIDGEVEFELAPGQLQRIAVPPRTPVEVRVPISFAPRIEFPAMRRAPIFPLLPPPAAPSPPAEVVITPTVEVLPLPEESVAPAGFAGGEIDLFTIVNGA